MTRTLDRAYLRASAALCRTVVRAVGKALKIPQDEIDKAAAGIAIDGGRGEDA